jgi:hypothetical protein
VDSPQAGTSQYLFAGDGGCFGVCLSGDVGLRGWLRLEGTGG